jgi:hypothetical protein
MRTYRADQFNSIAILNPGQGSERGSVATELEDYPTKKPGKNQVHVRHWFFCTQRYALLVP